MKFTVQLNDAQHEIDVIRQGAQLRIAVDGGEPVELVVEHNGAETFVLRHSDGRISHGAVHRQGTQRQLWVDGRTVRYERVSAGSQRSAADAGSLSSSIPAVVTELLVAVGSKVSAGDKLILLESMKMVIPIQAPVDGVVKAINCAPGDAVQPGVPLVELGE